MGSISKSLGRAITDKKVISASFRTPYHKCYSEMLMEEIRKENNGSLAERQCTRLLSDDQSGSTPLRPTTNILLAKICEKCTRPMHVHKTEKETIFAGCEPFITNLKLKRKNENEILIVGNRSEKTVLCCSCKRRHLLRSFEEVKDGNGQE